MARAWKRMYTILTLGILICVIPIGGPERRLKVVTGRSQVFI